MIKLRIHKDLPGAFGISLSTKKSDFMVSVCRGFKGLWGYRNVLHYQGKGVPYSMARESSINSYNLSLFGLGRLSMVVWRFETTLTEAS